MKIAHIIPANYAQKLHCTDYHLIISMIVLENNTYANFYKKCSEDGEYVICDNSTFELGHPQSVPEILKAVRLTNAKEVVAPDHVEDEDKTIMATKKFLDELGDTKISVMGVPQGEDWDSWMKCYEWMMDEPRIARIGISILALNLIFPGEVPPTMWRLCLLDYLHSSGLLQKPLHLLGMADNPRELKLINKENYSVVEGIDTSSAWVHGVNGHRFDKDRGLTIPKIKEKINFAQNNVSAEEIGNVKYNLNIMSEWLK